MRARASASFRRRGPSGFTLIELLIAAMIAILIFGIGFAIMNGAMLARAHAAGRIQSTESARIFFDRLRSDLDCAIPGPWATPLTKANLKETTTVTNQIGNTITISTTKTDYAQAQIDAFETKLAAMSFTVTIDTDLAASSVRYYAIKDNPADETGVMYREVSLLQPPSTSSPFHYGDPRIEPESALFPGISGFSTTFLRWDASTKAFDPIPPVPASATHIEVTLTFLDPNKHLPDRVRTFRELLALPEALK